MKKISILVISFLLLYMNSYSQDDETQIKEFDTNFIPSSPDAASLGSYGLAPVSLATGSVNVPIPIWEVAGKSISLPISLSYRPGVKIHDVSESTGHGWSLNAGGVITRNVNGLPDSEHRPRLGLTSDELTYEEAVLVTSGQRDAAPDEFSYNFNGYSGRFILEDDLQTPYYLKENQDWDFEFSDQQITIITSEGIQYIFANTEQTTVEIGQDTFAHEVTTSWFLSEIISCVTNEKIVFEYEDEIMYYDVIKNNSLRIEPVTKNTYVKEQDYLPHYNFLKQRIKSISYYSNDTEVNNVAFQYDTPRLDVSGNAHALSQILIYDNPSSNTPLKYFDFDIQHVNDDRIFLYAIQEFSGDGTLSKPPYTMEYINEEDLPDRFEYEADHWGYYSSNGTEFPYTDRFRWRNAKTKEPSNEAKYGSLSKLTFPTGGYNYFSYELNDYNVYDWNYTEEQLDLTWRGDRWQYIDGTIIPANSRTHSFSTAQDQFIEIDFCMELSKGFNANWRILQDEIEDYRIEIKDANSGKVMFRVTMDGTDPDEVVMEVYAWQRAKVPFQLEHLYHHPNDASTNQLVYYNGGVGSYPVEEAGEYAKYFEFPNAVFGECIDRTLYVDLPAGDYIASINTGTTDNDMVNGSTVHLTMKYHDGTKVNHKRNTGGLRIGYQEIYHRGTNRSYQEMIYYDYEVHDEHGMTTNVSSGTISEEPHIWLFTPQAVIYDWYLNCDDYRTCTCDLAGTNDLGWSHLYALSGRWGVLDDTCFDNMGFNGEKYTIKSKPYNLKNHMIGYTEVAKYNYDERENGFELHKFHGISGGSQSSSFKNTVKNTWSIYNELSDFGAFDVRGWPFNSQFITTGLEHKPKATFIYANSDLDGGGDLIKETQYTYDYLFKDRMWTASMQALHNKIVIGSSYFNRIIARLIGQETTTYDTHGENPIRQTITYDFKGDFKKPYKITTTNSKGESIIKKIKYANEFHDIPFGFDSSIGLQDLKAKNMMIPIEEQLWRNDGTNNYLIAGKLNIFDRVSDSNSSQDLIQQTKSISYKTGNHAPYDGEFIRTVYTKVDWFASNDINNNLKTTNLTYYTSGNVQEVFKDDDISTVYIWGYNQTLPIAKIVGASYKEVSIYVSNLQNLSNQDVDAASEMALRNALNTLRTATALSNAQVTTYTYDPSVGMTSMTDPRGQTVYYTYDGLNRLEFVKDANGHMLKEHQYNYQN